MNKLEKEVLPSPKEPFGLNAFGIETLNVNRVKTCLVSCEHLPGRIPKEVPWEPIEEEIKKSSLVFVEYFPYELESSVYNNPIFGDYARWSGEQRGINSFFGKTAELCKKHNIEIAIADIANNLRYAACNLGFIRLGGVVPVVLGGGFYDVLGLSWLTHGMVVYSLELLGQLGETKIGPFGLERSKWESLFFDMEDARRLLTARGMWQEIEKRKPGTQITYIAPRAHVSRVGWYLENPHDRLSVGKTKAYSAIATAFGLSDSTRIYKYSHLFNSWQLVSNIKTET